MKKSPDGKYWVDTSNNSWSTERFSEKEAKRLSNTLRDCQYCVDSGYLDSCEYCVSCNYSTGLSKCEDCDYCVGCKECDVCNHCVECIRVRWCSHMEHCTDCCYCVAKLTDLEHVAEYDWFYNPCIRTLGYAGQDTTAIISDHVGELGRFLALVDSRGPANIWSYDFKHPMSIKNFGDWFNNKVPDKPEYFNYRDSFNRFVQLVEEAEKKLHKDML